MPTSIQSTENEKLRKLFNQRFFGIADIDNNDSLSLRTTDEDRRKSNYSFLDYQNLVKAIEQYSIKDNNRKDMQISNSSTYGYKAAEKYYIQSYPIIEDEDDSNSKQSTIEISKLIVRKDNNKRLVAAPLVFDIIMRYHLQAGHKKTASTHNLISEKYCNITFTMVKFYIEHCPTCIKHEKDKNKKKKEKGPGKAILSSGFRDRIQMDLINYERDPQYDIHGVIMRYLLVLKDHFTKFVWLRPLPHKDAKFVHHALRCLFHEIGFPLILHSDNGSEFVNQLIETFITEESNSNTFMVNGAPRTPRVQGSVENINYHVQQCIEKTKEDLRSEDNPCPSWLECLPLTTSALNTTACHGNRKLTPYRHVYTIDHKLDIHFPNEATRAYASQNMYNFHKYIADPVLKAKIEAILKSDQLSISSVTSSVPPSYIDIPPTTNQDSIHSRDVDSCLSTEKSLDTDSLSHNSVLATHKSANSLFEYDWSTINPEANTYNIATQFYVTQRSIRLGRKHMIPSLPAVLLLGSDYALSSSNAKFKIIKGYLNDQLLLQNHCHLIDPVDHILIAEKAYYEYSKNTPNRWWENWLVETFFIMAMLTSPSTAKQNIAYLRIPSVNNPTIGNNCEPIHYEIKKVISFAWKNHHYATIVYDLTNGELNVYDGLSNANPSRGCKIWKNHINYVKERCHIQTLKQVPNTNINFPLTIGGLEFRQEDSFNCGPIACYVMWFYMNNLDAAQNIDSFSDGSVRSVVIDKLYSWLLLKQDEICSPSEHIEQKQSTGLNLEEKNTVTAKDDDYLDMDEQINYEKEILEQHCAQILLVSEYDKMRHTKKNKDAGSILRRKQNILSSTTNIGDIVSLHVHKKDRFDKIGKNIQAVVYAVSKEKAMGIKAITEHGIISWKNGERERWIGLEHFHQTGTDLYLPKVLAKYRSLILEGKFVPDLVNRITIQAAYKKTFPPPQKCKCKDNCKAECPCKLDNRGCTRNCTCKGKCCTHVGEVLSFDQKWVENTLSDAMLDFRKKKQPFCISNYRFSEEISSVIDEGIETIIQDVKQRAFAEKNIEEKQFFKDVNECTEKNENFLEENNSEVLSVSNESSAPTDVELPVPTTFIPLIERDRNVNIVLTSGVIKLRETGVFHKVTKEIFIEGIVRHVVNNENGFGFSIETKSDIAHLNGKMQSFTSKSFQDFGNSFYYKVYGHWMRLEIVIESNRYQISKHNLVATTEEVPISEIVDFGKEEPPDWFDIWYKKTEIVSNSAKETVDKCKNAINEWNIAAERRQMDLKRRKKSLKSFLEVLKESESESESESHSNNISSQIETTNELKDEDLQRSKPKRVKFDPKDVALQSQKEVQLENVELRRSKRNLEKVQLGDEELRRSKRNKKEVQMEPRRSSRKRQPNKKYT